MEQATKNTSHILKPSIFKVIISSSQENERSLIMDIKFHSPKLFHNIIYRSHFFMINHNNNQIE